MKNLIKILSLTMIISIALIGCKASDGTKVENAIDSSNSTETVTSPETQESSDDQKDTVSISDEEFVEEIRTIVKTTIYPKESLEFYEKYYSSVDSEIASEGLALILKNIENSQVSIENDFFNAQLDIPLMEAYVYESKKVDISKLDSSILSLYEDIVIKNAYRIHSTEGMAYPIIDYSYFKKYFDNITEETKDIIKLLATNSDKPMYNDGGFAISYDEIVNRILNTEDFLNKYPGSTFFDMALLNMKEYASAYMIGADNTPAFSYEDDKLNDDLKASFESFLKLYPKSKFRDYLSGYYDRIVENDLIAVRDYYSNSAIEAIYKSFDK